MDAAEVYESVDDFELYLAPPDCFDSVHPKVELNIFRDQNPADDQIFFSAAIDLLASTLLIRSCFKVGVTSRSKKQYVTAVSSLAMMTLMVRSGILDPERPNYRSDIREWIELIYPRAEPTNQRDQMKQLAAKAFSNCFGRVGRFETFILDMGCFLNHSCAPNAALLIDADLREASVISIDAIPAHGLIFISYIPFPIDSKAARKSFIDAYNFECLCDMCRENVAPSIYYATSTTQSLTSKHCWYCGQDGKFECKRCRHANYCSKACLQHNSSVHRKICKRLRKPTKLTSIFSNLIPVNLGLGIHLFSAKSN